MTDKPYRIQTKFNDNNTEFTRTTSSNGQGYSAGNPRSIKLKILVEESADWALLSCFSDDSNLHISICK